MFFQDNVLIQVIEPILFKFNSFFFLIVPQKTCFPVCYFWWKRHVHHFQIQMHWTQNNSWRTQLPIISRIIAVSDVLRIAHFQKGLSKNWWPAAKVPVLPAISRHIVWLRFQIPNERKHWLNCVRTRFKSIRGQNKISEIIFYDFQPFSMHLQ